MKILVVGGTGNVGSEVVRQLKARNVSVSVLTRSAEHVSKLPAGVSGVIGDLLDPSTLGVFAGFEAVFLLNPVSTTETFEGILGVNGARDAGVKRIVYLSVHDLDKASHLPHFGGKIGIEAAVRDSGMQYTIVRPNNFYQNDVWMKEAIMSYGVYPQPLGSAGVSRIDVRDIAEVSVLALTSDAHNGKIYNLVGPDPVTGESTAAEWSRALGKPIKYATARVAATVDSLRLQAHVRLLPEARAQGDGHGRRAADEGARPRAAELRRVCEGDGGSVEGVR